MSGLVVVDVDSDDPEHLAEVLRVFGETPRVVRTPRGGAHCYYCHTGAEVRNRARLPGFVFPVDLRGDGGYVLAPPSPGYTFERRARLEELPAFRAEVLAELDAKGRNGNGSAGLVARAPGDWALAAQGLPDGQRNDGLARLVGKMVSDGMRREWIDLAAQEFGRRCTPPMDPREVRRTVESVRKTHARNHPEPTEDGAEDRPILVRVADVAAERVDFLADPYLPRRKVSLCEGDPGLGKTWLALQAAAAASTGRPLFFGSEPREPASVLYMSAEDGIADTLRPRLEAAKADLARVAVLDGIATKDGRREVTLADLGAIGAALEDHRPALVVIDPIQGFLGSGVDMHRANEVRPLLAGLGRLAAEHGCAIVAIRHLRKSASDRATHRGLGSIDFAAAARSILLVGEDPDDPERRIVAHAKSNLAPLGRSLAFEIRDGAFAWIGPSDLDADDLLRAREPAQERASREEAAEFLRAALETGATDSAELFKGAKAAGISGSTLKRAKTELGIIARREGFGRDGRWLWELPPTEDA